jgi:hypothetical protein
MLKQTQPSLGKQPNTQRFKPVGKHLVVSTRIALDPKADADIIALLRHSTGMANLIRTALRICYQPAPPRSRSPKANRPLIELLDGHSGVRLSNPSGGRIGQQQVEIYLPDLPAVLRQLAAAQSELTGGLVSVPLGVTLPLSLKSKKRRTSAAHESQPAEAPS